MPTLSTPLKRHLLKILAEHIIIRDATKGICEWIFFAILESQAAQNFYIHFFLLKKGTRIVQRAILERDSFLVFKEDIYSLRVHSMCVLIIMPHVNDTLAFVCLREEN